MQTQCLKRFLELFWKRRLDLDNAFRARMAEAQPVGVQCLPRQDQLVLFRLEVGNQIRQAEGIAAAVNLVGENGTAEAGQVNANLMRSPRSRQQANVGKAAKALDNLVISAGIASLGLIVRDRHLDAVV